MRSRTAQRALVFAALVPWAILDFFLLDAGVLGLRLSHTMLHHEWRTATEIYSVSTGTPRLIARVYGNDWRATPPLHIENLPPYVSNAFIAAEDVRFRHHYGVDPIGMIRALVTNLRAHTIEQGGSTIDQQLVKAKFLTQSRTYRRKFLEVILAVVLDFRLSKDEILEAYLNDVYLGHFSGKAVLGLDEAARLFFDKRPSQLNPEEAALIAGIIRAPNRDTPDKRPDVARARRDSILSTMLQHHWLTDVQYRNAVSAPVELHYGTLPDVPFRTYMSALRSELTENAGSDAAGKSGLRIFAEIDPQMQNAAQLAVANGVAALNRKFYWLADLSRGGALQAAVLSVDPRNGGVRALVGGSDFAFSSFDRTRMMRRQPGSAFKTFAYLNAIERKKATASTLLLDAPVTIALAGNRSWEPHNYDERFRGRVTVREAFEESLNVPTVRLASDIGLRPIARTAKRFGFDEDFEPIPSLPLGVVDVSIRELTTAYTAFPNLGERVEPHMIREVHDANGGVVYQAEVEKKRVADAAPAYVMHSLLRGVVLRGTASRLKRYGLGHVAGKTGTTSDYRDAWFVGYTPDVVTTVWVGFDRGAALRLSSSEAALPIWASYMREVPTIHAEIAPPSGVVFRDIDPETGYLWSDGCPGPFREVYLSGTAPTHHCPSGLLGKIVRRIFYDRENFGDPPAVTLEQARRLAEEIDQTRQHVEGTLDRLRRIFGH